MATKLVIDCSTGLQTEVEQTAEEISAFSEEIAVQVSAQQLAAFKRSVQLALDETDMVSTRCFKAGVAFPSEWQTYTTSLRSLLSSTSVGVLPTKPSYPVGT